MQNRASQRASFLTHFFDSAALPPVSRLQLHLAPPCSRSSTPPSATSFLVSLSYFLRSAQRPNRISQQRNRVADFFLPALCVSLLQQWQLLQRSPATTSMSCVLWLGCRLCYGTAPRFELLRAQHCCEIERRHPTSYSRSSNDAFACVKGRLISCGCC